MDFSQDHHSAILLFCSCIPHVIVTVIVVPQSRSSTISPTEDKPSINPSMSLVNNVKPQTWLIPTTFPVKSNVKSHEFSRFLGCFPYVSHVFFTSNVHHVPGRFPVGRVGLRPRRRRWPSAVAAAARPNASRSNGGSEKSPDCRDTCRSHGGKTMVISSKWYG